MKKGEKKILALLIVLAVALVAVVVVIRFLSDRTGPVIRVSGDAALTYHAGITEEELLSDVTAWDEKDGDVSDTLRVTAIYPGETDGQAVVVYMAKDSHNNVTKYNRILDVEDGATIDDIASNTPVEPETETEATETEPVETETAAQTEADPEAAARESVEADIEALPAASPVIRLTTYNAVIPVGGEFRQLSYVESITDDKDAREVLYQRIMIDGAVNPAVSGTYQLVYSVTDTDGNASNRVRLTVTVQ